MNEYLVFFVLLEDLFFIDYEPYLADHISDYHSLPGLPQFGEPSLR